MHAKGLLQELQERANPRKALELARYFKTGPGEYAAGDVFLGITVPDSRAIARNYRELSLSELKKVIKSPFHEARFSALIILVDKFKRAQNHDEEKAYFDFYINELRRGNINNWDLVDVSAPTVGAFLLSSRGARKFLHEMAIDENLWVRRTSILFTFASLRIGDTKPTIDISTKLLGDEHDLIQKAVGWALREVGKIDQAILRKYLTKYGRKMSRTTLRYAIEKFSAKERKMWLEGTR